MARGHCAVQPNCHLIPQTCRLIVVDVKERGISLLYKSMVFNTVFNVPLYDVCLLLHEEHYYALTSLSTWFGMSCYCVKFEKHTTTKNQSKSKSDYICTMGKKNNCMFMPSYTLLCRNVFEYFATVPVSTITNKTLYAHGVCQTALQSHLQIIILHCKKQVIRKYKCFEEVEKTLEIKSWLNVFTALNALKTR